eukprot:703178-Prorocentrum_minimum.AAC.1
MSTYPPHRAGSRGSLLGGDREGDGEGAPARFADESEPEPGWYSQVFSPRTPSGPNGQLSAAHWA